MSKTCYRLRERAHACLAGCCAQLARRVFSLVRAQAVLRFQAVALQRMHAGSLFPVMLTNN